MGLSSVPNLDRSKLKMNLFLAVLALSSSLVSAKSTFARQGVEDDGDAPTFRPPGIEPKDGETEASEGTTPSLIEPRETRGESFARVAVTARREAFSAMRA